MNSLNYQIYYFEELKLIRLIVFLFRKKFQFKNQQRIFYVDASHSLKTILIPLLNYVNIDISPLIFELKDIRDKNGELVRARISRVDLFEFEQELINSKSFATLSDPSWKTSRLHDFILKGFTEHSVMVQDSVSRLLFLFEVIDLNNKKFKSDTSVFFINNRPWLEIYKQFATKYNISLLRNHALPIYLTAQNFPRLYFLGKYLKCNIFSRNKHEVPIPDNNLFLSGRGDLNFDNNGEHSDYFWYLNSEFPATNIITECKSAEEANYFRKHNTVGAWMDVNLKDLFNDRMYEYQNGKQSIVDREYSQIKHLTSRYNTIRTYWSSVFRKYKIKTFLTWNKYDSTHIAISDAIRSCGGVSAVWQMAYDGFRNIGCRLHADINFAFSKCSSEIEQSHGSMCRYQVITGYPKTYAKPLLMERALALRERMHSAGAENIIFVIDENAGDDSRWHTGHSLLQENYSKAIQALFSDPSLGVIFKPKTGRTLKRRLGGDVYDQLMSAKETGRCHVYENVGLRDYTTASPPMLAALSADLCIHGHLAGTAAMECALIGKPTLLIDREGVPFHNFYELLPRELVIFENWDDAILASREFFKSKKTIPGFGDWNSIINVLDPFHDEKAANRVGSYLHSIFKGFEKGMDCEETMLQAAEIYSNK